MIKQLMLLAASAIALFSSTAAADDQTLKAGDSAPDFTLKDSEGNEHTLSKQLKESKVALVFYRSADW